MKKLIVATRNLGKIKEIKKILSKMDFLILSLEDIGYEDAILEDGNTFIENAMKKANVISNKFGELTLADDSGLEVDALGGKPGVLSARFAGIDAKDIKNNQKLLRKMEDIGEGHRGAQFKCAMVLAIPGHKAIIAEGICRGRIAFEAKGDGGFGYDPVFIPSGYDKTMAELPGDVKNMISHRAKALRDLESKLQKPFSV